MRMRSSTAAGDGVMAVCSAIGLAVSIYNYFQPDGVGGSGGALLVIVSSALILAASFVRRLASQGWRITLGVLLFLGILGTGFAAYMLEAWLLLGLMALAMIGWLVSIAANGSLAARPSVNARATP